jgi:hypothetical protein
MLCRTKQEVLLVGPAKPDPVAPKVTPDKFVRIRNEAERARTKKRVRAIVDAASPTG